MDSKAYFYAGLLLCGVFISAISQVLLKNGVTETVFFFTS